MAGWVIYIHLHSRCLIISIAFTLTFAVELKLIFPCFIFCQVYLCLVQLHCYPDTKNICSRDTDFEEHMMGQD